MINSKFIFFTFAILLVFLSNLNPIFSLIWLAISYIFFNLFYNAFSVTFREKEHRYPKLLLSHNLNNDKKEYTSGDPHVFSKYPDISKELNSITHLIVRDYILNWFERIDKDSDSQFPVEVSNLILQSLEKLSMDLDDCDLITLIVMKLIPLFTNHFNSYRRAKKAIIHEIKKDKRNNRNQISELTVALEYNKTTHLHDAVREDPHNLEKNVETHLRSIVMRLLPYLVDNKELTSPFVSTLLREIIITNLLEPLVNKFSEPDNWNLVIVSMSKKILKERNQVHKVRRILTEELKEPTTVDDYKDVLNIEGYKVNIDLTNTLTNSDFEAYLKQISFLNSYSDLRATKFILAIKLLKLDKRYGSTYTKKMLKNDVTYRKRLMISLNLINTKLKYIQPKIEANIDSASKWHHENNILFELETFIKKLQLNELFLNDSSCLLFFRRYLDLESKEAALLYLNYWELISSFKNPLEDVNTQDLVVNFSESEAAQLITIKSKFLQGKNLDTMNLLDKGLVKNIIIFADNPGKFNDNGYLLARKSVLLLQKQAQFILNKEYFPGFKKSNLFLKMISAPEFTKTNIYAKYFGTKDTNRDALKNQNIHPSNATVFTNPGINDALDKIVNGGDEFDIRYSNLEKKENTRNFDKTSKKLVNSTNERIFSDGEDDELPLILDDESSRKSSTDNSDHESNNSVTMDFISDTLDNTLYDFSKMKEETIKLSNNIVQINKELDLLKHLILKADLTDNRKQLKLLKKSQRTLARELQKNELLRQQYIIQENANSLYQKTKTRIGSYYVDTQMGNLREVAYYVISIDHIHNEQVTSWEIPRRYSEFYELNKYLKKKYTKLIDRRELKEIFPPKIEVSWRFNPLLKSLYGERQIKLETYLKWLLTFPDICRDDSFRRFLTDTRQFKAKKYNDKNSDSNYNSHLSLSKYSNSEVTSMGSNSSSSNIIESGTQSETVSLHDQNLKGSKSNLWTSRSYDDLRKSHRNYDITNQSFLKPVCDLFISLFSLNRSNSIWLRGGAIVLVLQQLFGGTIEKYIKDSILRVKSPDNIYEYLVRFKNVMWGVDGILQRRKARTEIPLRTSEEKKQTKKESKLLLITLLVDVCGKVVGRRHAKEAGTKIHEVLQNRYLNASLLLESLDVILEDIVFSKEGLTEKEG